MCQQLKLQPLLCKLVYLLKYYNQKNQLMSFQDFSKKTRCKDGLYSQMRKNKLAKFKKLRESFKNSQLKDKKSTIKDIIPQDSSQQTQSANNSPPQNSSIKRQVDKVQVSRINSQVSISQDIQDTQSQNNKSTTSQKPNSQSIAQKHYDKDTSLILYISGQQAKTQTKLSKGIRPQVNVSLKNFINYLLDFKSFKIQSYSPAQKNVVNQKVSGSSSPQNKQMSNSLQVDFTKKEAVKDKNKQQTGNRTTRHKLGPNQSPITPTSTENAGISNLLMSSYRQSPRDKLKRHNSTNIIQMKKQPNRYYNVQNPHQHSSSQQSTSPNALTKSQNLTAILHKPQSKIVTLEQLKGIIGSCEPNSSQDIYGGYFCDQCKMEPIVGKIYRCLQCEAYDLCQQCYRTQCFQSKIVMKRCDQTFKCTIKEFQQSKNKIYELFQTRPLLKKQMGHILQQELLYQKKYFQTDSNVSSLTSKIKIEQMHSMEQFKSPTQKKLLQLQKILRKKNWIFPVVTSDEKIYKEAEKSLKIKKFTTNNQQK